MNKPIPLAVLKLLVDGAPYTMAEYKAIAKASRIQPHRYLNPRHGLANMGWAVSLDEFRTAAVLAWEEHEKRTKELLSIPDARILR